MDAALLALAITLLTYGPAPFDPLKPIKRFQKAPHIPSSPVKAGTRYRVRTCGPYHVKVMLYH
ncbi:MAG: hypothetical protein JWO08_4356 [Verrucomicrobiaceae bacterium]|nr:hypothetical protein [Verrucomicrobiaceae bacterium]